MRPPLSLVLLGALLLGAVLWLGWNALSGPEAPPVVEDPGRGGRPVPEDEAETAPVAPAEAEVVVALEVRHDLAPPPHRAGVRVVDAGGRAVPGDVQIVAGAGVGPGPAAFSAGEGPALVRVGTGSESLWRRVLLDGGEGTVTLGAETVLTGRVRDGQGAPVVGARVWAGRGPLEPGDDAAAVTDGEGRFEIGGVAAGAGVPLVVAAEGHAHHGRFVDAGFGAEPVEVRLGTEAILDVQLAATVPDEGEAGAVVVPVAAGASVDTAVLGHPFFRQAIEPWVLDGSGRVTVRGLPRGTTVDVAVVHPALRHGSWKRVELERARQQVVVPRTRAQEWVEVRVVDPAGAPVTGAVVVGRSGRGLAWRRRAPRWLLPRAAYRAAPWIGGERGDGTYAVATDGVVELAVFGPHAVATRDLDGPEAPIVLPGRPVTEGGALRVRLGEEVPWRARREGDAGWTELAAGEVFETRTGGVVADVVLRVRRDGGTERVERFGPLVLDGTPPTLEPR